MIKIELDESSVNDLVIKGMVKAVEVARQSHHVDICIRINGKDEWFEADWVKHLTVQLEQKDSRHNPQEKLKEIRARLELSQRMVAEEVHISSLYVCSYENNKYTPGHAVLALEKWIEDKTNNLACR